jgi:predicted permease
VSFLGVGILIDQLGTYMVLSTLGIIVAVMYSSNQTDSVCASSVIRKVIKFAPFQALLLALILRPIEFPGGFEELLSRLGSTLAPLALVSVGYQLRLGDLKGRISALTLGLLFKPPLVTLMVGIGIPLSFLTLPLWWYVLQGI